MVSITGKALTTVMNPPVAARLVADSFLKSLQRLKPEKPDEEGPMGARTLMAGTLLNRVARIRVARSRESPRSWSCMVGGRCQFRANWDQFVATLGSLVRSWVTTAS